MLITIREKGEIKAMMVTGIKAVSLKNNMNFGATYTRADRQKILDRMGDLARNSDAWLDHGAIRETKLVQEQLEEALCIFRELIYFHEAKGRDIFTDTVFKRQSKG